MTILQCLSASGGYNRILLWFMAFITLCSCYQHVRLCLVVGISQHVTSLFAHWKSSSSRILRLMSFIPSLWQVKLLCICHQEMNKSVPVDLSLFFLDGERWDCERLLSTHSQYWTLGRGKCCEAIAAWACCRFSPAYLVLCQRTLLYAHFCLDKLFILYQV